MSDDAPTPLRPLRALAGPAAALVVYALLPLPAKAAATAAVAAWMAVWWLLEAVPIPVASLLPLLLLPAAGVASLDKVGAAYGNPVVYLFLGGFLLALGLEETGLHRRIAWHIVAHVGERPRRLVLAFFASSALISMWISNTATAMIMLPIAMSVLATAAPRPAAATSDKVPSDKVPDALQAASDKVPDALQASADKVPDTSRTGDAEARLAVATMLAVAYGASIGGMATLVGTAPNLVLVAQLRQLFPGAPTLGFGAWMIFAVPLSATLVVGGWALLVGPLFRIPARAPLAAAGAAAAALRALGAMSRDERAAAITFASVALLWVTGDDLRLGADFSLHGWRSRLGLPGVGDAAVAIAGAIALFLWPSQRRRGEALLTWEAARRLPYGLLLLFGGGFALADAFATSGLSAAVAHGLSGLQGSPPLVAVTAVTVGICALTELTSNTATTTLMLPIAAQLALALPLDPRALMIATTLAASCAFMLPVATPPNAIVFGTGKVTVRQMAWAGLWFNVLASVAIVLLLRLLGGPLLGIDWDAPPAWAIAR